MRAQTALMHRLKAPYAATFVRHLPLLDFLVRATRSDHKPLLSSIEKFLRAEEGLPALLANLDSPDYRVRRRCFELTDGAYIKQPEWVSEKALTDSDVVIRYRAYAQLFAGDGSTQPILCRAAQDSFARIRRLAFAVCIQRDEAMRRHIVNY